MKMSHTSGVFSYARRAETEVLIFNIENVIFFPFELS